MDPKSYLDYALFQLTPTRTRCDLVVFSGKKSEKLASGLVDPFVSHLKYAKDEILKGGYSITLRLPSKNEDASWFTKATFQRFVRFVSTPEILERIIRIEKEILQIDGSNQSNETSIKEVTGGQSGEVADGITKKSSTAAKLSSEVVDGAEHEENSRVRLQRLMDTRKALLQKEQAMAYARAVVAGYEIESIDDLICFADTFGASRLRVACVDFKELYKKKHADDQWMDELAAVQAYPIADMSFMGASGIMLASDNMPLVRTVSSEPISDATVTSANSDGSKDNTGTEQTPNMQQQVPWMNQMPQYMYNYQGQPISPYQSYPFPGMHPPPQYYTGHMGWPAPGGVTPNNKKSHKSSRRKDANGTDANDEDEETPSSDSYSQTESEEEKEHEKRNSSKGHKKNKKKNSKTVVIRNINYITSQRRNGEENEDTDDSSSIDESSIREGVDDALASLEKHGHSKPRKNRAKWSSVSQNGSNGLAEENDLNNSEGGKPSNPWGAFQDILMNRDDSIPDNKSADDHFMTRDSIDRISEKTGNMFLESEKIKIKPIAGDDSVFAIQRNGESVTKANMMDFANGEYMLPSGRKIISENENSLLLNHSAETRTALPDFSSESATLKSRGGEDWFVVNSSGGSVLHEGKNDPISYERGVVAKEADRRNSLADDSFIIESRPTGNEQYVSNWRTDIGMEADIDRNAKIPVPEKPKATESDEFCMMLVRESHESVAESWKPEMDYEVEISFNEADKAASPVTVKEDPVVNGKIAGGKKNVAAKNGGKDAKPKTVVSKSRLDFLSKSKKVSPVNKTLAHKSKLEKEEEERKRMEEIRIQRQKRIAERSASASTTKKIPVGNKTTPPKLGKS